jgi:hypothetical protein
MTQGAGSGHGVLECWLFFFLNRTRRRGARKHRACIARGQSSMTAYPRHTGTSSAQNTGKKWSRIHAIAPQRVLPPRILTSLPEMGRGNIIHRRRRESRLSWVILKVTLDDLKATSSPGPLKNTDTQHHLLTVGKQGGRWASHHVRRTCI